MDEIKGEERKEEKIKNGEKGGKIDNNKRSGGKERKGGKEEGNKVT